MRRALWCWIGLAACDGDWEQDIHDYDVLVCNWQEYCAESTAGLDCSTYADQLVVRPDPCVNYDAFYMPACLSQMRDQLGRIATGQSDCTPSHLVEAPACGQAIVRVSAGQCAVFAD
jgi:hypothetical protein